MNISEITINCFSLDNFTQWWYELPEQNEL